jgi:hypothetical protein
MEGYHFAHRKKLHFCRCFGLPTPSHVENEVDIRPASCPALSFHGKLGRSTSATGHQRTSGDVRVTSAFPLIATELRTSHHVGVTVCFAPNTGLLADIAPRFSDLRP